MHWISTSDELVNRAIFESFPDPIAVVDGQLNLRFFNAPFAELVNEIGAVSLAVGMAPGDYLLERDRSLFERHLALALGGDPSVTRLTNPPVEELSSGREYHFVPVRTPDGEIDGVLISIRSSLRTCQKRMEEREEWHMAILETAAEGIVVSGEDGCIEVFNAAAERMFGYDRQEVLGHPLGVLMPPSLRERHDEHLRNYVASGEGCHVGVEKEVQGRRKDGSVFPMNIGLGQARIAGRYVFTAIVQDLTERKYFEERIRRAEKMEAVGLLAGGVAHDFNNLLTIVASYGHLIAEDLEEGSEHWDYLTRIRSAAERGARLTRQLLVFSASPDGEPRTIVINEIVVELEKLFHRVLEENVKLETVLAKDLHPIKVDPGHLEQLLMNLVINARDAMPRGGRIALRTFNVRVEEAGQDGVDPSERHSVSCRPRCFWSARAYGPYPVELSPGHHVVLEVKDDGQGMDGAVMSRIMEPFFTTKPSTRGTGLGLSTVYGIVQRYEGLIYVWSRPGEGSTFTVYFPAFLGEREEGKRAVSVDRNAGNPTRRHTILLVEDDKDIRTSLRLVLEREDFFVLEAPDAEEALQIFEAHNGRVDLLLTDVILPGMNGIDLVSTLTASHPGLRSIIVSGYSGNVLKEKDIEPGLVRLAKPYDIRELKEVVYQLLGEESAVSGE